MGIEEAPTDRLFFAILPDARAVSRISRLTATLRAEHGFAGKPTSPERLHATVHFVGSFVGLPSHIVDKACDAAAVVRRPPFEVCFDRAGSFRGTGRRPLVLQGREGIAALSDFQQALSAALNRAGLVAPSSRDFIAHVTLLYDARQISEHAVEPPVCWTVDEFVLMRSMIAQGKHVVLRRWPLLR